MKNDHDTDDMTLLEALLISIGNDLNREELFAISDLEQHEFKTL